MRKTLITSVAVLGLATGPALAQVGAGSTQTPPSLGTAPPAVMATPVTPPSRPMTRAGIRRMRTAPVQSVDASAPGDMAAPPTSAYRGGAGSPLSTKATNLSSSKSRSGIGSRLPDPNAAGNSPEALLIAAQKSLDQGKTGAAQQALEMAETRVLSRTTDPSMANLPDSQAMVQSISAARHALGANDIAGAKRAIQMAASAPVPPPGPAVTTTYPPAPTY